MAAPCAFFHLLDRRAAPPPSRTSGIGEERRPGRNTRQMCGRFEKTAPRGKNYGQMCGALAKSPLKCAPYGRNKYQMFVSNLRKRTLEAVLCREPQFPLGKRTFRAISRQRLRTPPELIYIVEAPIPIGDRRFESESYRLYAWRACGPSVSAVGASRTVISACSTRYLLAAKRAADSFSA